MFLLQWVGVVAEHSLRLSRVQHIVRYPGLLSTVPILIPVQLCPRDIFRTVIEVMVEVCVVFYMFLYGWPVSTDSTKNKHSVGSDETIIYYFGAWWVKERHDSWQWQPTRRGRVGPDNNKIERDNVLFDIIIKTNLIVYHTINSNQTK